MADKKRLEKLFSKVTPISKAESERDAIELESLKSSSIISKAVASTKELIAKSNPDPPEQKTFSFLPTAMTRISPFFPMSRRELKDRPFKAGLTWETSWGKITVESGSNECLAILDETIMLAVLELIKRQKSFDVECSAYEIGKIIQKNPNKGTYDTVWRSLKMLMKTIFTLEIWEGKGKDRKPVETMCGNILTFIRIKHKTNRLDISMNPFFGRMFAEGFITGIDMDLRRKLKGDVSKALYRFFQSHRAYEYSCHFLTIAGAINLNVAGLPNAELKKRLRKGLAELRKKGFLKRWTMPKDVMTVWKSNRPAPKD